MKLEEKNSCLKKANGITLIALVVTIIVLIILAGISINLILGDNGIITKAEAAKENVRGADVKEIVAMRKMENEITKYGVGTKYSKTDVIDELEAEGKLLEEEVELLKETDVITIGDIEIDFSILDENTTEDSVTAPEITLTYDPPLNEYTNGTVVVTANTNATEYTIEMSTDGSNWNSINSASYDANGKVYARLSDGTTILNEIEGEVTNIDKTNPEAGELKVYVNYGTWEEVTFNENNAIDMSKCELKVELVNGSDTESGHKKTTYSVEATGVDAENESYQNLTESIILKVDDLVVFEETTTTANNIINNENDYEIIPLAVLRNNYTFVVTTEDNAGNISSNTYTISVITSGIQM